MDELTSPQGSVALAISALLLVAGYRLARPERAREWLAIAAYAVALAGILLGARGVLPGATTVPGPALRLAGAALVVAGLVVAGKPSRDRRRAVTAAPSRPAAPLPRAGVAYAGLALVLVGQLARAPSLGGAAAAGAAVLACLQAAAASRR
jgi:hypothetical protein